MSTCPRIAAFCRALIPLSFLALALGGAVHAHREMSDARAFHEGLKSVTVKVPDGRPPVTQESIDLAMTMYAIEVPGLAMYPTLDRGLTDRGLTTRATFLEKAVVTVGPAAFESWGLLGSTLAHELEIHCQQNFLAIYFLDLVGLDGTGAAERQAYVHELRSAKRFGLHSLDAEMIADTMEYFYPESGGSRMVTLMPRSVRNWLAKNLIHGRPTL